MESPAVGRGLPWRRIGGIAAGAGAVTVVLLGLLVRIQAIADEIDGQWMEEVLEMRGPGWEAVSRVFDFLGGGWFAVWLVPIAVAGFFLIVRRPWAALVFIAASALSAGLVQVLKALLGGPGPPTSCSNSTTAPTPRDTSRTPRPWRCFSWLCSAAGGSPSSEPPTSC
jgi:undecaprenyl-diphosphatase